MSAINTEWAALEAAAQRLRAVATQDSLVARSAESGADDLRRAGDVLVRLRARLLTARAAARVGDTEPVGDRASLVQTIEDAIMGQKVAQMIAHADSLLKLFSASSLTPDAANRKQEIKDNMRRLAETESVLYDLRRNNKEIKYAKLDGLKKHWEECSFELKEKLLRVNETETEEMESYPEKSQLINRVRKMELMRQFISRFVMAQSDYDILEDKNDLRKLWHYTREPITLESVMDDIKFGKS